MFLSNFDMGFLDFNVEWRGILIYIRFSEPDNPDSQKCGAVYKDGTWKSDQCELEKEFACKLKSSKSYTVIVTNRNF
jgi:hypothetical protein